MFKKTLFIFMFSFLFNQEQSISNLSVSQRTDGSGIINISYDLLDPSDFFPSFTVTVQISFDGGESWEDASNYQIEGDFGDVQPGTEKNILLWAPSNTFTQTALIKLLGEGHYVTSELPFSTVTISPDSILVFESETIDYSYQIMQYELTNAQLVEWLETYSFGSATNYDSDNPWDDTADAQYSCNNYNTYQFNNNNNNQQEDVWGCMDSNALNYNPGATQSDHCVCVYETINAAYDSNGNQIGMGIGCNDCGTMTLNGTGDCNNFGDCGNYDDCSCQRIEMTSQVEPLSNPGECSWSPQIMDIFNENSAWMDPDYTYEFTACTDPNALNYAEILINECATTLHSVTSQPCCEVVDTNNESCVYQGECDNGFDLQGYSSIQEYYENQTYEDPNSVTIKDFQTPDISYEGSAFTIAPGRSDYPVRFDGEDCVHSTVLSLYMNYFGLRIPTAGEWMKAARGDNTRCWPWMDGTCGTDGDTYCSTYYDCLSNDEANDCSSEVWDCQSECEDIEQDCQNQWEQSMMSCMDQCIYSQDDTGYAYPDCYNCVDSMSEMQWAACMSGNDGNCYCGDFTTLIQDACPECVEQCMGPGGSPDGVCDQYDVSNNENSICGDQEIDFNQDGQIDNPSCHGTYSEYCQAGDCDQNNCWGGNNECDSGFNDCAGINCGGQDLDVDSDLSCSQCNSISIDNLSNILQQSTDEVSDSSFLDYLYYNRFNIINDDEWSSLQTVGQYPLGISPYGLYDVIGNAPELVSYSSDGSSNTYYAMGIIESWYDAVSFCNEGDWGDQNNHPGLIMQHSNDGYSNAYRWYGVRLIRIVNDDSE